MTHKKLDSYLNLCMQVYDLSKPNAPEEDYRFYRSYIEKAKGPILEPMCGTGRFLLPFVQEGFDVQGFDASEEMLNALYTKAKLKNLKPIVWNGFVENLKRPERYKLIFIPSGSFCLITDLEAAKAALKVFYDHLDKDGIFLFESETLNAVPSLGEWKGNKWYRPDGKMILLSKCSFFEDEVCNTLCKYELIGNNSVVHTEVEEIKVRIYKQNDLIELLKNVGFKSIRIMKAFDNKLLPSENDESVIYECVK